MSSAIPRDEHPRPQWVRPEWFCLNGPWQFEIDAGDSGLERGLRDRPLRDTITVPFCPESPLSGIGCADFLNAVWYRREVTVPDAWKGRRVLLHFQAVDYDATVWVNGVEVGRHRGGWTGFSCDLSGLAEGGQTATIVVRARDDHRESKPMGKQSRDYANQGCRYTRTTGIWQTVWMEAVPKHTWLLRPKITPDLGNRCFRLVLPVAGQRRGMTLQVTLRDGDGIIRTEQVSADRDFAPTVTVPIPEERVRLWEPERPHLYDMDVELRDSEGRLVDRAAAYAGLRSVTIDGKAVRINGRAIFQRLVLDQGFYPDGVMTAPTDAALRRDIELSMQAGFNGARLHQKVFEERFLYHADRMGYLCWGEFGDWGARRDGYGAAWIPQWLEALERDYSHPCLVGWCGLNETYRVFDDRIHNHDDVMRGMFLAARAADPTRPVLDVSGYSHRVPESDIYDSHDYEQDPAAFAAHHAGLGEDRPYLSRHANFSSIAYRGQPYFVSEFGGIWWNPKAAADEPSWGYGQRPKSVEEFHQRFEGLCRVLLDHPHMFGYCYTQLTDVHQEQNGIYGFDRSEKLDVARIRAAQQRPAAIEKADH
ncbi:MAG TPA: beta-galactosidase [Phycisphaerales bacterium]|nr:beta-galactosidase [Phycisphaerales bacterium]